MRTIFRRVPIALAVAVLAAPQGFAQEPGGELIYRKQCARCHGPAGEGTKKHAEALAGDKSVAQLAEVIARTMPEDNPKTLSAVEAKAVAEYVLGAFYSKEARERNRPPRIELARLTVKQYRATLADLVGSFRPPVKWGEKRGLRGEYFDSRTFRGDKRALDRLDPEVKFDFGTNSPGDKIAPEQFAIRWSGSVLAPETGTYEFVVRTEHAARLWVNEPDRPLIDAWVRSAGDVEHRSSVFLIGGRAYPVRLEFSKAKQGVDDSKKNKPKPVPAAVSLAWKRPHGALEVIPSRNLLPDAVPESFVVATAFPPDDRSYGGERGTTVSKAWDQATTDAAIEAAGYVAAHADELAGVRAAERRQIQDGNPAGITLDRKGSAKPPPDRDVKLRAFARKFAERAFRRPLTDEQAKVLIDRQFEAVKDPETAVKRVVLLVLKSPRFLYREVGGGPDQSDVAARLAFALWDSLPDQELLDAAAAGRLGTREQVAKQAERMLADPRAQTKLREFLLTWLKVDQPPDVSKDPKRFPGFDAAVVSDLRTSLELALDDAVRGEADFRQLLLADDVYLNGRLAKFYGADRPADAPFAKVKLDPAHRAGVLTHPYLLAAFAYSGETSPIHRGVFLARGLLGVAMRPPPEAFVPLPAELHPNLTTRERVALQTKPQACMGCHTVINPLGFTLETFDAIGRYREQDRGKPVDAVGAYQTREGKTVTFAGARELAKFLAQSPEVHAAFAGQLFHHLVQQSVGAYGPRRLDELTRAFAAGGYDLRKLAVEAAVTASLTGRDGSASRSGPRVPAVDSWGQ